MASMGTVVSMYQNLIKEWTKRPVNLDTVGNLLTNMKVITMFQLTIAYKKPFTNLPNKFPCFVHVFVHFYTFSILLCSFLQNLFPCLYALEYFVPASLSLVQHLSKLKFDSLLLIPLRNLFYFHAIGPFPVSILYGTLMSHQYIDSNGQTYERTSTKKCKLKIQKQWHVQSTYLTHFLSMVSLYTP